MALGLAIDMHWQGDMRGYDASRVHARNFPRHREFMSVLLFFSCAVNTAMAPGRFSSLLGCWMRKHIEQTSSLAAVHGQWKHNMSKQEMFATIRILELLLLQQN